MPADSSGSRPLLPEVDRMQLINQTLLLRCEVLLNSPSFRKVTHESSDQQPANFMQFTAPLRRRLMASLMWRRPTSLQYLTSQWCTICKYIFNLSPFYIFSVQFILHTSLTMHYTNTSHLQPCYFTDKSWIFHSMSKACYCVGEYGLLLLLTSIKTIYIHTHTQVLSAHNLSLEYKLLHIFLLTVNNAFPHSHTATYSICTHTFMHINTAFAPIRNSLRRLLRSC